MCAAEKALLQAQKCCAGVERPFVWDRRTGCNLLLCVCTSWCFFTLCSSPYAINAAIIEAPGFGCRVQGGLEAQAGPAARNIHTQDGPWVSAVVLHCMVGVRILYSQVHTFGLALTEAKAGHICLAHTGQYILSRRLPTMAMTAAMG